MPEINWFDQPLPFRRRHGEIDPLPLHKITDGHNGDNPIVGIAAGHPILEWGTLGLIRHILQLALSHHLRGSGPDAWLEKAPDPEALQEALQPYRPAFWLDDPACPAMQIRPRDQREAFSAQLEDLTKAESDDDEADGAFALHSLLPGQPTTNVRKLNKFIFDKGLSIENPPLISAGLTLPLLYATMVLFPQTGGGQYSLPEGGDCYQFMVHLMAGDGATLWRTLWLNVTAPPANRGVDSWPAPCNRTVFPWLDKTLADLPTKRGKGGERVVALSDCHRHAIPMPRRYLLAPATDNSLCAFSGLKGPSYGWCSKLSNGLQYRDIKTAHSGLIGYLIPKKRQKKGDTESQPVKPIALKAKRALRWDDWIGLSISHKENSVLQYQLSAYDSLVNRLESCDALQDPNIINARSQESSVTLRAIGVVPNGKVLSVVTENVLPLHVGGDADTVSKLYQMVDAIQEIQKKLEDAVAAIGCFSASKNEKPDRGKQAALFKRDSSIVQDLAAQFMEQVEPKILAWRAALLAARPAPEGVPAESRYEHDQTFLRDAKNLALKLFEQRFPVLQLDDLGRQTLLARRYLLRLLFPPQKTAGDTPAAQSSATPTSRS